MTSTSAVANDAARKLWTRAAGSANSANTVSEAAERLCSQLRTGLGRWIGAEGYRVLLSRVVESTRAEHPGLDRLSCLHENGSRPAPSAAAHKPAEITAAMLALVAGLIELLGHVVGEKMAVQLIDKTGLPSPRGVVSIKSNGGRDG